MRLRPLLLILLAFVALLPLNGCQKATTPTEAAALQAAATDTTAYTLPPDKLAKADALAHTRTAVHFTEDIWGILQLWLILQFGLAARMRNLANNLSKNRWAQGFTFLLQFLILTTILNLPLTLYAHHVAVVYGMSVQHLSSFLFDEFKGFLLTYLFGGLGVMLLFYFIRKFPRRWWIPSALAAMALGVLGIFATPYIIDPLFNRFEPLSASNPALVAQLEKVVARGQGINIPPDRMFLMKASDKVTTLNAYVTGFGSSKRVVVWDTSIAKGTPEEISFIFGHEMGHYVLGHIVQGLEFGFAMIAVGFFIAVHLFQFILRHKAKAWRVHSQDNWAALVVLLFVFSILSFIGEPIGNTFSRSEEHAADVYGEEVVHGLIPDPQATAHQSFQLLGENSFTDPNPSALLEFWTYSHPSISHRAAFAERYDPWAPGAQPKYFSK
ncbi:M48 family metallopeptidase [Granulicella tundricola]|uniref:Peptidase M48 Ste24p n=1 Tax=Granulicella tundricola (strain ATCC BAA-1859 / DSM 23138 / MP5ACTX9) TaxID=1198114 RepID=E8WZU8_GRATM|nr:M48 family metallopeptidase [Granulicella tundricola]ADW67759.1 peptidase M48 Ste24p [Granulicella tundricola MP5ACTX9]